MHELSDKIINLDKFFIKIRVPNHDFKLPFSFSIKEALERTGIQDKDELIRILNKLRDDPALDVGGYDRPLIRAYKIIGENIEIIGCKTRHIEDHITEIKESKKRKVAGQRIKIYIDKQYGIYLNEDTKEPRYNIHNDCSTFKMIIALKKEKIVRYPELYVMMQGDKSMPVDVGVVEAGRRSRAVSRNMYDINNYITKNLKITQKFIVNDPSSGYSINTEAFEPEYR